MPREDQCKSSLIAQSESCLPALEITEQGNKICSTISSLL